MSNLVPYILEHLLIVLIATGISVAIGVVLGIISYWVRFAAQIILWFSEMVQTIPALALLAILMVIFGLGNATIIAGLALYALLPIVRNTYTGLTSVPAPIKEAARGMGMSKLQRLFLVELPLAFPLIFSGIKISVVNSLSIAVMGVLIGAGGLGFPIYRGIQTQNFRLIMSGAIPVVIMAVLFDYLMSLIQKRLTRH
ncbi:MAG TPA: ABC transporter permease [Clostridiales bacterium]|jgi:osmoprotectant transport system permease protein|nr:ABC transporter permease [Clostridiales bacterium]